jgi:hypothetical protein
MKFGSSDNVPQARDPGGHPGDRPAPLPRPAPAIYNVTLPTSTGAVMHHPVRTLALALAGALLAFNVPVAAQTAAPKHACVKPDDFPGRLASENARRSWTKTMDAYGECIKKYAADQRAIADAALKSGNEAIEEYNAVVAKARSDSEKAAQ